MTRPTLVALLVTAATARGELPSIRFDRLTPLGGAAGTTVELEVAGAELDGVETILFDHPGLKATFVKDKHFKLAVGDDVPAGTYDARLVGRFGVSNPRSSPSPAG